MQFGLKSSAWFQRVFDLKSQVWFETKIVRHEVQLHYKCIVITFSGIQSTFRSLEMHCKRRNEICICLVILGELESFRNYNFPKILDELTSITKVRIFLIPLAITFLNPKILGSLFSTKNSPTWEATCEKLNFRKSSGIYKISFEYCT